MDKAAIKRFATTARSMLMERVAQKAAQFGITPTAAEPAEALSINGKLLSAAELQQRASLLSQIRAKGYAQVMEEVAYTWFNRFCALRFMEVNHYLPSRVRIFSNEEDAFEPQILAEALDLELPGLNREQVIALKQANDKEGLFKYLLITQCNALNPILPGMFQRIADYTELLFPDNLLREGSVIHEMVTTIPTDNWQDAVQIIGWLYQFYISEKKDAVLAKKGKVTKEEVPARTQLFTPDWIVRYMVENSLGRLWVEGHPNEELKQQWRYFLEEAEQEPEVQAQLADIRKEYAALQPEDLKCIDPCMGSGHILAYMFDVLMQIYESAGYSARDAVRCIVQKNLYGLDIDDRAAQLAYFAVMMKARQYDRRFLSRVDDDDKPDVPQPHVYAIQESNAVTEYSIDYFAHGDAALHFALQTLVHELRDAKEYGSLIKCTPLDYAVLYARAEAIRKSGDMQGAAIVNEILPLIQESEVLASKYDAVVTNPPYMGSKFMNPAVASYIKANFADVKEDLFSAFVIQCIHLTKEDGSLGFLTPYVWMFITSYEAMRKKILSETQITSMVQLEYNSFEAACVPVVAFTLTKKRTHRKGVYVKLSSFPGSEIQEEKTLEAIRDKNCTYKFSQSQSDYSRIPGSPIAYWVSEKTLKAFTYPTLGDYGYPKQGLATGDNDNFLRLWHEVSIIKVGFGLPSREEAKLGQKKWFPCNKGGSFRRWYGNNTYLVNWENDGKELLSFKGAVIRNPQFYFKSGITWSSLTSGKLSMRLSPKGFIFESKGSVCFLKDEVNLYYILGLMNTEVVSNMLLVLSPTLDYHEGPMSKVPILIDQDYFTNVSGISKENVHLTQLDWDSFETSWDFKRHPLLRGLGSVQASFEAWERKASERFYQLKANEEELNRIFIDIYSLQDELTPEVEEKYVTVRKADLGRDIRSLISYAVGCMFGRYSLDVEGLAYAGGEWDAGKYKTFPADADNIIPICDDEYFEDDIVGRFVEFIRVAYGAETLEENLSFIAEALGGKGSAREVIRKYFRDGFYADHLKIYQKRPIYWQFDSGKKGGFRALVYMHRYAPDTIARIRTDYVHEQQSRYRTVLEDLAQRLENAAAGERVKLSKQQQKLQEQATELREYEEKIHHLANRFIAIDLDAGVKNNYAIFSDVLAKIK